MSPQRGAEQNGASQKGDLDYFIVVCYSVLFYEISTTNQYYWTPCVPLRSTFVG